MSVGNLVVELTLNDGQYQANMRQAGQAAQTLSGQLNTLNRSTTSLQSGLSGTIPHLRDIAIITSSIHSIVSGVADTFGSLTHSLVGANAEIERSSVLLQGLSKSVDMGGKLTDAARDMNFLFETAKQAPFALKELSNAFVKMKVVGLDDVESKLKSVTNAIANFGGNDESLHRTTVAIQQMASKGVISMEELRQQLGESVPSAMQNMADGMGMTMATMTRAISQGKVKAIPAIDGMLREMEFSMTGSSARMMETWNGMVSQLSTNWALFAKKVGDSGSFDSLKTELKSINEFLQSDEAIKYAQSFGDGIMSVIDSMKQLKETFVENKNAIVGIGQALLAFWAITKTITSVTAMGQAATMGIAGVRAADQLLGDQISRIRNPTVATVRPPYWGNNGRLTGGDGSYAANGANGAAGVSTSQMAGRISSISSQAASSTELWRKGLQSVGLALSFLSGPIGTLAIGVALIGSQFLDFSTRAERAEESLKGVIAKQKELNEKPIRVVGDSALKTIDDINKAKDDLEELKKLRDSISGDMAKSQSGGFGGFNGGYIGQKQSELKKYIDEIMLSEQAIAESKKELMDRTYSNEVARASKAIDALMALRSTQYKTESEMINKQVEEFSKSNADEIEQNAFKHELKLKQQQREIDGRISDLETLKSKTAYTMASIAESSKGSEVVRLFDLQAEKKRLEDLQVLAKVEINKINIVLRGTKDSQDRLNLTEALKIQEGISEKTQSDLSGINAQLQSINQNSNIDLKIYGDFSNAFAQLKEIGSQMGLLKKAQQEVNAGNLAGDAALQSGMTQQEREKELKKVEQSRRQQMQRMVSEADTLLGTGTNGYDKNSFKNSDSGLSDAFMSATSDEALKRNTDLTDKNKELLKSVRDLATNYKELDKVDEATRGKQEVSIYAQKADEINKLTETVKKYNTVMDKNAELEGKLAFVKKNDKSASYASDDTIRLTRELERTQNPDTKKQLEASIQQDELNAKIRGAQEENQINDAAAKKAISDNEARLKKIDSDNQHFYKAYRDDEISQAKFLNTLHTEEANEKRNSDALSTRDSVKIYEAQLEDFKSVNLRKLENHAESTRKIIDDELVLRRISKQTADEANAEIDKQIAKENEKAFIFKKEISDQKELQKAIQSRIDTENKLEVNATSRIIGTANEKDIAMAKVKYEQAVRNLKNSTESKDSVHLKQELDNQKSLYEDELKQVEYAHRTSFDKMMQDTVDFKQVAGDAASQFTNGMIDGFAQLATNGKTSFQSFTASVLQGISQMLIKMALLATAQKVIGMVVGSVSGGMGSEAQYNSSTLSSGLANFNNDAASGLGMIRKANGGIVSSMGEIPLKAYAGGGVANSPQLTLFGEGRTPEAFVPLPDGRSIPVTMKGGVSGGDSITIQINVDNKGNAATDKQGGASNGGNGDMWGKMADSIKGIVVQTITEQKRPGGQLYSR